MATLRYKHERGFVLQNNRGKAIVLAESIVGRNHTLWLMPCNPLILGMRFGSIYLLVLLAGSKGSEE